MPATKRNFVTSGVIFNEQRGFAEAGKVAATTPREYALSINMTPDVTKLRFVAGLLRQKIERKISPYVSNI